MIFILFFFNDTATTEIYTLSLHDALPIWLPLSPGNVACAGASPSPRSPTAPTKAQAARRMRRSLPNVPGRSRRARSEEHTSELQSRQYLVCRLLLEKKKNNHHNTKHNNEK